VAGGVVGGVVGGVLGGKLGGQLGSEVLPFGEGMSRPQSLSMPLPQLPREAREAKIAGLMLVKCTITVEGRLENCRVAKPLPFVTETVLEAMKEWRYTPVTYQGRAVAVDYTIPVRIKAE
jgi:protein TonB